MHVECVRVENAFIISAVSVRKAFQECSRTRWHLRHRSCVDQLALDIFNLSLAKSVSQTYFKKSIIIPVPTGPHITWLNGEVLTGQRLFITKTPWTFAVLIQFQSLPIPNWWGHYTPSTHRPKPSEHQECKLCLDALCWPQLDFSN